MHILITSRRKVIRHWDTERQKQIQLWVTGSEATETDWINTANSLTSLSPGSGWCMGLDSVTPFSVSDILIYVFLLFFFYLNLCFFKGLHFSASLTCFVYEWSESMGLSWQETKGCWSARLYVQLTKRTILREYMCTATSQPVSTDLSL